MFDTVSEHGLRLIATFEGGPHLTAYTCPGGVPTIGLGATYYPDGRAVCSGDTITFNQHLDIMDHCLSDAADAVNRLVTVDMEQHQFDALVSWTYNLGEGALAQSTMLKHVNARRWEDAAAEMTKWVYTTRNGRKVALRGLYRRRCAEACMLLGYEYEDACEEGAISDWEVSRPQGGAKDIIVSRTPWVDILANARSQPLAPPVPVTTADLNAAQLDKVKAEAPPVDVTAGPDPSIGTKERSPHTVHAERVPYNIDPEAGLKPLEESDRAKGFLWQQMGMLFIRVASLGAFGSVAAGFSQMVAGDPILMEAALSLVVAGGVGLSAFLIKWNGDRIRKRGEADATQGMY